MTHSFDIFDTCLVRACQAQTVFDILASRLMADRGESVCFEFSNERVRGENKAIGRYTSQEKEDVTLSEIYSCCDFGGIDKSLSDASSIMEVEMQVERDVLTPVKSVVDEVSALRKQGHQIVFISDMYLPYSFVKELLQTHGLFQEGDHLYISGQEGKRKSTGNLYKLVHEELGVDYCQWVHHGDNPVSDVAVPRKLGIKVEKVVHRLGYYENRLRLQDYTSRFQSANVMSAISKSVRLQAEGGVQRQFACELIAPAFVSFVYGVLCDAKKRGIVDIHFMARDSYIFYEIAQTLRGQFPDLRLHYLYVSRDSLYLPGLPDTSLKSLKKLFLKHDWADLENILSRIHMLDWLERMRGVVPAEAKSPEEKLAALLGNPEFKSALNSKWQEQRSLAVGYFVQEDLGNGHSAVVDLRGTRRCQMAINEILLSAGLNQVMGYYFEVSPNSQHGGDFCALNFSWRYGQTHHQYRLGPYGLYEQYFCVTPFKRTYEYAKSPDGKVVPVYERDYQAEDFKKRTAEINVKVCKEYARLYSLLLGKTDHWLNCEKACSVLTEFFQYPKPHYLNALKDVVMSDSSVQHNSLLKRTSILSVLKTWKTNQWAYGNLIYNSFFPEIWRMMLKLLFLRKERNHA